jgi:hypothetical protein
MVYVDFSIKLWWIDSGATAHVANSMEGLNMLQTIIKGARKLKLRMELKSMSKM